MSVLVLVDVAILAAQGIRVLVSRIDEEIKQASGSKDHLEELKERLTNISWLLAGANSTSDSSFGNSNPMMDNWLKKIKDVSDDVEDLLDEWSYETLKVRFRNRKRDKFKGGFSHPLTLLSFSHKMKDLKNMIQSIYVDAKELGIEPIKVAAGDAYAIKPSRLIENKQRILQIQRQCVDHESMIGRDEDITHLVRLLCNPANNNKDFHVIGIVGFPGLGKTTLIKRVSNVEEVSNCFNSLVIWLVVSHNFDLIESLNRMVEILFGAASNMKDKQALIMKLQEKLKKKKYLLILDDVWDTTFWEPFRLTLQEIGGSKGSTLLVTSRYLNVVERMETYSYDDGEVKININQTVKLKGLSEVDSWSLFMARVSDENLSSNREKESIARKMIKYCGGVPLAVRALGDLLRDKDIGRWKEIEKSDLWKKQDEYGIFPSLRLSYNCLPNAALKKCFAYCAIFEENEVIEKDRLINMWMAHGFLQPFGEMELIGEEYFKCLLNSSFFQDVETDKYGNVKTVKMHNLVWSMACVVSMGDYLCSNEYDGSSELVRHLSVPFSDEKEFTLICCTKLQTCLHKGFVNSLDFLLKCTHLRVLSVGRVWDKKFKFEMLSSLKHLRYLELNVNDELENLKGKRRPPICKPYHLQTLWIRSALSFDDHSIPKSCAPFFRNGISDLVNLRHIHYSGLFGIPEGLGHLTALQTLPIIDLKKNWGGSISELRSLSSLRGTLEIRNLNCINVDELQRDPSTIFLGDKLELIDKVVLNWDNMLSGEQSHQNGVLEALKPNSNLKVFKVCGYLGTKFPIWLIERTSTLQNLVSLSLKFCLYGLGDLKMDNFKYLRFLSIRFCWNLSVSFPYDGFQCCKFLEQLQVINCTRIVNLPNLSPLTQLRCLHFKRRSNTGAACELVGLGSLSCLQELETNQLLPTNLDKHSPLCKSLQILTLGCEVTKTVPIQLQHLVALKFLKMEYHSVETIPEWLGSLTHLRDLLFQTMPKLKRLPSKDAMHRLSNLNTLQLNQCLILRNDFRNKTGEWFKVAHILNICVDGQPIDVKTPKWL